MKIPKVFVYAGLGAALMYLFDPENGPRRRENLRTQAYTKLSDAEGMLEGRSDELSTQAVGLVRETRKLLAAQAETASRVAETVAEDIEDVKQELKKPAPSNTRKKTTSSTSTRSKAASK